ncbi:MAG: DUF1641 domain-containing protein [Bacteroidales bacterium]|nr:DUF1641 domain-containing protein [Bacteroidales bacterium]MCF8402625.1 DUF1641 domain-containing protein [Bacteroidales bacterium]
MTEQNIQNQIDDINRKLDIILEEVFAQKQNRESMNDLMDDLSIVGKDVFKNTVVELDKAGVELDGDALKGTVIKIIRNIGTINEALDALESFNDFIKDASPIARQVGLDTIQKMNELDQKGYIEFFRELTKIMDNIVTHFSADDVRDLADNIVIILETVKGMTQPDVLKAMNNGVEVFKHLNTKDIPEYSLWKAMKEMRSPEMKKGLGFMITFLKNLSKQDV